MSVVPDTIYIAFFCATFKSCDRQYFFRALSKKADNRARCHPRTLFARIYARHRPHPLLKEVLLAEHLISDAVSADPPAITTLRRRLAAEAVGSFFLFVTVVGSGIMAENLAGGNVAIALLGNTIATGAILFVLITILAPISGAHMNPAVSLVALVRGELPARGFALYVLWQLIGGIIGIYAAHVMFGAEIFQFSAKARTGIGQWTGEFIATFGLILTILGAVRFRPDWVAPAVAFYITAGYWFTSSTSFANPAIAIARCLSDSFAGIAPADVPMFIVAELLGALAAAWVARWLIDPPVTPG